MEFTNLELELLLAFFSSSTTQKDIDQIKANEQFDEIKTNELISEVERNDGIYEIYSRLLEEYESRQ